MKSGYGRLTNPGLELAWVIVILAVGLTIGYTEGYRASSRWWQAEAQRLGITECSCVSVRCDDGTRQCKDVSHVLLRPSTKTAGEMDCRENTTTGDGSPIMNGNTGNVTITDDGKKP